MSEGPSTGDSVPDLAKALVRKLVPREALLLGGFAVLMLGAGGAAVWASDKHIDERVDAREHAEQQAREALEERFETHVQDSRAAHAAQAEAARATRAEVREAQADIRALYRALRTGQAQERLERPPDGGMP